MMEDDQMTDLNMSSKMIQDYLYWRNLEIMETNLGLVPTDKLTISIAEKFKENVELSKYFCIIKWFR